jgi:hypothetical protein
LLRSNTATGPKVEAGEKKKAGRPKGATAKVPAMPTTDTEELSAAQVKEVCLALADKIKKKEPVLEILKKFGGVKVDAIDPKHYPAIVAACENYSETTTNNDF